MGAEAALAASSHPLERIRELPPGVAYMPKPWKPLNVVIAAEQALAIWARELISAITLEVLRQRGF
jgi:hypothetical protein